MSEDDRSRQMEEVEALTAIYAEQFHISDEQSYIIDVDDGQSPPQFKLSVKVTLPPDYPSSSPPTYQISAPWLRGEEHNRICGELENIYCENIGECILFTWVQALREFVVSKSESPSKPQSYEKDSSLKDVTERTTSAEEIRCDEDDDYEDEYRFDPKLQSYNPMNCSYEETNSSQDMELPEIHHGEIIKDRKSVFQGHLARVTHKAQVKMVMDSLLESKKIAEATHNIQAYRISCDGGAIVSGCVDDGETHAGSRMLHLMSIVDACNVLVVVTRWYGGVHLGPDRFKHINNCTRQLLEQHGFIREKNVEKKGPKSNSKDQSIQEDIQKHPQKHGKKNR